MKNFFRQQIQIKYLIIQISDNFDIFKNTKEDFRTRKYWYFIINYFIIELVFILGSAFNNIYFKVSYLINPFLRSVFLSVVFFSNRASIPTSTFETHVTVVGFKFEKNRKMESFYSKYSLGRVENKHKSGTSITDRTI